MKINNPLKGQNLIKLNSPTDKAKAIAILGITIAGIYIVYKTSDKILAFFGITESEEQKKENKAQEKVVDATKKQVKDEAKKGNTISYHPAQYVRSAQVIHNATYRSALDDNNNLAITELLRYTPKDVDFYQLQDAYGTKPHYWFGVPVRNRTLVEALQEELDDKEKARINNAWASRKMISRIN
jgi:hypothetical protein